MAAVSAPEVLSQTEKKNEAVRRWIFAYDLLMLAILLALAWWYFEGYGWSLKSGIPELLRGLPVYAVWFGALGGVVISLKGIYDHNASEWQGAFNLWHMGRPFSAAIAGGVTFVLLLAVSTGKDQLRQPIILAAAFIMGTQEKRFFNFLYEVARLIVQVPGDESADTLAVTEIHPPEGGEGSTLTILGQGFDPGVKVTVGGQPLTGIVVNKDGTSITGKVPAGGGQATILIVNPDGAARSVSGKFSYHPVSPTSLSFRSQQIGSAPSAAQVITFANTGTAPVTITNVSLGNTNADNFTVDAHACTNAPVKPGATCTITVRFTPKAPAGDKSAIVTIAASAGGPYTVSLDGTATEPPPADVPAKETVTTTG